MYPPHDRMSIQTKGLPVQNPMPIRSLCTAAAPKVEMERALSQEEAVVSSTKNYQDDLQNLGLRIKQHEDHIKSLRTQKNIIEDSILDLKVTIGKYHTSTESETKKEDTRSEEEIFEHLVEEKSAAGLICQLKARHDIPVSHSPPVKDVLGIVATLGYLDDENLSRLLAEFVGKEAMLALVCKTFDGIKALELYDKEGAINRSSGLHGIGSSVGRTLEGRFRVICLNDLRPYDGEFIADDPQRRLDLLKPKLPGGDIPRGFVGYAVNLVHIDNQNLFCVTTSGHGLRETLFYYLFSHLQVYRTREDMQQALPFINDGAVSLDGGIIRSPGVFDLGNREDAQVKFPRISGKSSLPESYYEVESSLKSKKWNQERLVDEIRREQSFLDQAKFNFEIKKKEFVRFLAQSSQYAPAQYAPAQQQSPAGRERFAPR
ncbi:protein DEFECTIVE IN MERISTEM SILENCING 3 [Daucus carota subsp. sativus]|uniref:protein DEFECTIVE IN MERISTEM SILENCING 3 n=1 Tax=Daucus carota subsp. sativus TaxID=79200 RepID=UPI0007EF6CEF|nr:PREDICTED: protein DEFECTIVE IN MERISTEM SILENCING 3-like [Daucus carota subsp. sativus]